MLEVIFKFKNSSKKFLVKEGLSILEIARIENLDIEGSCEGSLACSTCHVFLKKGGPGGAEHPPARCTGIRYSF